MHYDLIVIGMGLSGLMAAKTAVEMGRRTLIVGRGMGSLCLFSNTIDLLGCLPESMDINDGLSRWIKEHPRHPYSAVGSAGIGEAIHSFISMFPPPYSFQSIGNENCLTPTGAGTVRPTYLVPSTMVAGTSFKKGKTLIVGFEAFKDFSASWVSSRLNCRGTTVSLPGNVCGDITASAIGRLMEKESLCEMVGQEVKKRLDGENLVGLPAVLGIKNPFKVKKDLERIIGAEIFEIPILPPSIPGMRIFNRFKVWLIERGTTFLLGPSVSKVSLKGRFCQEVQVANPPVLRSYSADRCILATGRFVGGGLIANGEKLCEPVFNLPVTQPGSREDWFGKSFFDGVPHPIHQAGISVDSLFQPTDEKGRPVLENLWVAGSILAHHHSIDEKSREGIEIATGYMAAKRALEK